MHPLASFLEKDKFVKQVGIELLEIGEGTAKTQLEITPQHCNAAGDVQGGVLFTLADFTFAAAVNSYMKIAVTLNANIHYFKAVSKGMLYATAKEISLTNKIGTYEVEITNSDGERVALFVGTAYRKEIAL